MRDEVTWDDPPEVRDGGQPYRYHSRWRRISDQLRAKPGEWAVVTVADSSAKSGNTAYQIRTGVCAGMPAGEFDAVARTVDGEHRVYARFVGPAVVTRRAGRK